MRSEPTLHGRGPTPIMVDTGETLDQLEYRLRHPVQGSRGSERADGELCAEQQQRGCRDRTNRKREPLRARHPQPVPASPRRAAPGYGVGWGLIVSIPSAAVLPYACGVT
jgi:hypothetical protein